MKNEATKTEKNDKQSSKKEKVDIIKRSTSITCRLTAEDTNYFKKIAYDEGIPYLTYIAGVLHKVAVGKLLSEKKLKDKSK